MFLAFQIPVSFYTVKTSTKSCCPRAKLASNDLLRVPAASAQSSLTRAKTQAKAGNGHLRMFLSTEKVSTGSLGLSHQRLRPSPSEPHMGTATQASQLPASPLRKVCPRVEGATRTMEEEHGYAADFSNVILSEGSSS